MLYRWFVFLHILGASGFLLAHGGSASVLFRAHRERTLERLRAILELSSASFNAMYGSLLLMLVAGVITGFLGDWWGSWWIWASMVILLGTAIAMFFLATGYFNKLRRAAGLPWFDGKSAHPAGSPVPQDQLTALQGSGRPSLFALLGLLPIALLLWLMVFKPF
jgi:uncharacterized membrane protein